MSSFKQHKIHTNWKTDFDMKRPDEITLVAAAELVKEAQSHTNRKTCYRSGGTGLTQVTFSGADAAYRFCLANREAETKVCKNCNIDDIAKVVNIDDTLIQRHLEGI